MTGRVARIPTVLWLAGAAFAAVVVLLVAISVAGVSGTVVAGIGAAAVTGAVSIVLAVIGLQDRQREADERRQLQCQAEVERTSSRQEEHIIRALDYFTGHTQRRNVGIAIVEGYWHARPDLRGILIPLLANQAVYLLEGSKQREAIHEADNCRRIVELLLKIDSSDLKSGLQDYYHVLFKSVDRRYNLEIIESTEKRGVDIPAERLKEWLIKLRSLLAAQ